MTFIDKIFSRKNDRERNMQLSRAYSVSIYFGENLKIQFNNNRDFAENSENALQIEI